MFSSNCVLHVSNQQLNLRSKYFVIFENLLQFHVSMVRTLHNSLEKQIAPWDKVTELCALHILFVEDDVQKSGKLASHINNSPYKRKAISLSTFLVPTTQ